MQITGTVQSQALHPEGRLVTIGTDEHAGPRVIVTTSTADADTLRIGRSPSVINVYANEYSEYNKLTVTCEYV